MGVSVLGDFCGIFLILLSWVVMQLMYRRVYTLDGSLLCSSLAMQ